MARVLIFEDHRELALYWEAALEEVGHETWICSDRKVAEEIIKRSRIDVLVLDILIEDNTSVEEDTFGSNLHGLKLLQQLKSFETKFQPRVIAVSGYPQKGILEVLDMAKALKADITLKKPISTDRLLSAISQLVPTDSQAKQGNV